MVLVYLCYGPSLNKHCYRVAMIQICDALQATRVRHSKCLVFMDYRIDSRVDTVNVVVFSKRFKKLGLEVLVYSFYVGGTLGSHLCLQTTD
jgi:hypothetical protein